MAMRPRVSDVRVATIGIAHFGIRGKGAGYLASTCT